MCYTVIQSDKIYTISGIVNKYRFYAFINAMPNGYGDHAPYFCTVLANKTYCFLFPKTLNFLLTYFSHHFPLGSFSPSFPVTVILYNFCLLNDIFKGF